MKLAPIVIKIRAGHTRFGNNIAGAAEFAVATQQGMLQKEAAFVVQLDEVVTENNVDGGISQIITERFGVITMLDNALSQKDKTGLTAYDTLFSVRKDLFKALLGWQMDGFESLVTYAGGKVVGINRAQLWYQFEFAADVRIDNDDGVDMGDLPEFKRLWAQYILADGQKYDNIDDIVDGPPNRLPADSDKVDAEQKIEE